MWILKWVLFSVWRWEWVLKQNYKNGSIFLKTWQVHGEKRFLGIQELTNSGWLRYRIYWWLNLFLLFLSIGTIQTVVMTAVQRTPRTVLLHSVSSQWAWARSYYLSVGRLTHQPAPSLLPYHLALDCVWTSRRGGSLFTMHTLCGCCGRGLLIAPPLFAQRSVLLVVVLCSCKSW